MERVLYTIQNEQKATLWNTRNGGTVNNCKCYDRLGGSTTETPYKYLLSDNNLQTYFGFNSIYFRWNKSR